MNDRTASIKISDIASVSKSMRDDGTPEVTMHINSAEFRQGYSSLSGKPRFDFISPNFTIRNWMDELKYDGYFCFVDTNKLTNPLPEFSSYSHATAFYLFQLEELEIQKDQDYTTIIWKPDWRNSKIHFQICSVDKKNAEKFGWSLAVEEMIKCGVKKAKIFVDAHQKQLATLSKDLPEGWDYYYVSSDRGGTLFNLIFRRLDKLIDLLSSSGPNKFVKVDIEKYLMGNVQHLKMSKG